MNMFQSLVREHRDALDLEVGRIPSDDDRVVEPGHTRDDRVAKTCPWTRPTKLPTGGSGPFRRVRVCGDVLERVDQCD